MSATIHITAVMAIVKWGHGTYLLKTMTYCLRTLSLLICYLLVS